MVSELLMVALAATPSPTLEAISQEQQALFERVAPSVVYVGAGEGFGSGFFVTRSGLVLTNAHVVGSAKTVSVVLHDGRRLTGTVVEKGSNDLDVALVQVPLDDAPALTTDGAQLRVGAWVGAVGHGAGAVWTFSTGMLSNIYPSGAERPVFQTQIPLNPGNSGGPIFDAKGQVLGLVTAGLKEATAINFGISMDVARRALERLSDACACVRVTAPAKDVPIFFDGKLIGTGPVVVAPGVTDGPHEVFTLLNGKRLLQKLEFPRQRRVELGLAK